jgi:L-ascorbate metabolism protein UlaG (beta-lactamase superfamily)
LSSSPGRLALLAAVALAAASASGCALARVGGRGMASFFTDSPKPVKREKQPVRPDARLAVVWVGHATALIQIGSKVVLTDPVFTSTVGQVSKRLYEPGIAPEDLPPVDAVLISHLHYDHLSLGSLEMIEGKVRQLFLPPTGLRYLTDFGFPALELQPWQSWEKGGLRVTAVPVAHVGYRYGVDREYMTEGFTGYVIEADGIKVYFGGDTAYDPRLFVTTGQAFPGIELALLPIGPIEPHAFMRDYHMDPREALSAFVDLGARRMVPVHYDTFVNSVDAPGDALRALEAAQKTVKLAPREVVPIGIGERRVFVKKGEALAPMKLAAPPPAPGPAPAPSKKDTKKDDDD